MSAGSSMISMSSENLSTDSPVGVMDIDPNAFNIGLNASFKDEYLLMDAPQGFSEDPLEWLLDGDIQSQLPESSIEQAPMFPDFGEGGDDNGALTLQAHTHNFDASLHESIMDPKLTVQSLFLGDAEEMAY